MRRACLAVLTLLLFVAPVLLGMDRAEMERISAVISANYAEGMRLFNEKLYAEAREKLRENFPFEESVRQIENPLSGLSAEFNDSMAYDNFLSSYLYAGRASVMLNDTADALVCFSVIQKRVPLWSQVYREIAHVYVLRNDMDAQMKTWELCIDCFTNTGGTLAPTPAWVPAAAYQGIGALSLSMGDLARTIECGEKAVDLIDRERVQPLMLAGLASLRMGKAEKAMYFYARAVEEDSPGQLESFKHGLRQLTDEYVTNTGSEADPVSTFFLWAMSGCAHDGELEDHFAQQAASDPRVTERVQAVAEAAELDTGSSYAVARFFAASRHAAAAVQWLTRATNGSPGLAVLRVENDPAFSFLRTATDYKNVFGEATETMVTQEYYDAVEQAADFEMVVQDRHHKRITGAAMSPDGRFIVTSSGDRKVNMWTPDGVLLRSFRADRGLTCVAFSPTGRYIVAGTEEGSLRLWTIDGKEARTLEGTRVYIEAVAVSPDGRYIAATTEGAARGSDYAVRLWSRDGSRLRSFLGHYKPVINLVFSPDGQYIATLDDRGEIRVWDVVSGQCTYVEEPPGDGASRRGLAYFRKGDGLYFWENPRRLRSVTLLGDLIFIRTVFQSQDKVDDIRLSVDGTAFLARCSNGSVRTWTAEGKEIGTISFPNERILDACFTPDGGGIMARTSDPHGENSRIHVCDPSGSTLHSFPIESALLVDADMSRDGSHAASIDETGVLRLWRADGKLLRTFPELTGGLDSVQFNEAGDRFVISDHGNNRLGAMNQNASVWELDGRLITLFGSYIGEWAVGSHLEAGAQHHTAASFTPYGSRVHLFGSNYMYTFDVEGRMTREPIPKDSIARIISIDGERNARIRNGQVEVWDTNGVLVDSFTLPAGDENRWAVNSPDGGFVAIASGGNLSLYTASGTLRWEKTVSKESITDVSWSQDGKLIAACSEDTLITIWSTSGTLVKRLPGHRDSVRRVKFVVNDALLFSYSDDSTMGIWNIQSGAHYFFASSGEEWIAFTDDGYFDCSHGGGAIVSVVKGVTAYGIDQFALTRNRPDVFLSRTGAGSPEQIAHYAAQYRKRIAKIAPLPASVPTELFEATILPSASTTAGRKALLASYVKAAGGYFLKGSPSYAERLSLMSIPAFATLVEGSLDRESLVPRITITGSAQSGSRLSLAVGMRDPAGALYRYNIYVNDVPVLGSKGKEVRGAEAVVRETIELTPGLNKVEAVCINTLLVESFRDRLFVEGPAGPAGNLYVVSFGVSLYKEERLDLNYAHKDAEDLGRLFASMEGRRFGRVFTKILVNQDATVANISKSKEFLEDARVNDTVVLFIAGHGMHDRDSAATYYYLTHESNLGDLAHSAATFETLEDMLEDIAPRSKLFLMDTCESGEIDEDDMVALPTLSGSRGIRARTVKKGARGIAVAPSAPIASRDYLNDRDRFVYNDLTRRSGAIVFSSCRGGEVSYETDERRNGLFTASLIDVLTGKTGAVAADELLSNGELSRLVSEGVARESDDLQHPTVDRDNLTQKLHFPVLVSDAATPEAIPRARDSMGLVEGGELVMGLDRGPEKCRPKNKVFVDSFLISACEVTVREFREFIESTSIATSNGPGKTSVPYGPYPRWTEPFFSSDPSLPAVGLSYNDAAQYCNWLSVQYGYSPCYSIPESGDAVVDFSKNGFRLPTEAEWQWAASGGVKSERFMFSGSNSLSDVGWFSGNSGYRTHPVMKLRPNELGLYDMSGNAFEWCNDLHDEKGYTDATYRNPRGPTEGFGHVVRGGCWLKQEEWASIDSRSSNNYWQYLPCLGMRLARNAGTPVN